MNNARWIPILRVIIDDTRRLRKWRRVYSDSHAHANSNPRTNCFGDCEQHEDRHASTLAMSTSFQPAEWDYQFFTNHPTAIEPLGDLNSSHIRIQAVSKAIPQQTNPNAWDFTMLDAIAAAGARVGDHSPEFQVAFAPAFMYQPNTKIFNDREPSACSATTQPTW